MQTPTLRHFGRHWARSVGCAVTAVVIAVVVADAAGAATTPGNAPGGASGSVAALSGSSMEVQSQMTGQTTVAWTATTQFSKTVSESVGALSAGQCVTVTGTSAKSSKTTIAARAITVAPASANGLCTGPARLGVGTPPNGGAFSGPGNFRFRTGGGETNGSRPSLPNGARLPALSGIAFATGKVTAVHGSTISLNGISLASGSFKRTASPASSKSNNISKSSKSSKSGQSSGSTKGPSSRAVQPKAQNLKITTSSSTTVTANQAASSSSLAVGDCVSAFGPAAANGTVTATNIRITSTGGTSCSAFARGGGGFFGGGPGGPGGPGAGTGGQSSSGGGVE